MDEKKQLSSKNPKRALSNKRQNIYDLKNVKIVNSYNLYEFNRYNSKGPSFVDNTSLRDISSKKWGINEIRKK